MSRRPFLRPRRRGTIIPLLAICTIALFAFIALAVDVGLLMVSRTECQNAADTAALTGARMLDDASNVTTGYENNRDLALALARSTVTDNINMNTPFVDAASPGPTNIDLARIGLYDYDTTAGQFRVSFPASRPTGKSWGACEMIVRTNQNTFFARVLGISSMPVGARAVAVHRPRDIALILDASGSMANGSTYNWGGGLMSPDPLYPKFGHYSRFEDPNYPYRPYTAGTTTGNSNPGSRPHPLFQTDGYRTSTNLNPPNNYTAPTRNGPAIVHDYFYDPVNFATPSTAAFPLSVSGSTPNLVKAFHNWNPAPASPGDPENYIAPTYTYTGYDAFDTTGQYGPLPAPDNFATQTDVTGINYVGDKWPRKYGAVSNTASWSVYDPNGSAINAYEFLGWSGKYSTGTALPNATTPPNRGAATGGARTIPNTNPDARFGLPTFVDSGYATDWSNFRDATWETFGYDLDVQDYVTRFVNVAAPTDPRVALAAGTTAATVRVTPGKFKGYSMGPGYWGKTFFIWPPDPRTPSANDPGASGYIPGDWRERYFTSTGTSTVANSTLFTNGTGQTLRNNAPVNYTKILRWLKAPPRTVPPNLRAGRVLYYSSIPDTVSSYTTDPDQRFWKEYIDYVLGVGSYTGATDLAGPEGMGWPENGTSRVTPSVFTGTLTGYDLDGAGTRFTADTVPYMNYRDNPSRPRLNFWFGPQSMLAFISLSSNPVSTANWSAATSHEAQSWQLKAGVNSGVNDIRTNHPNDYVGLTYFSADLSGSGKPMFSTIASPMSQRYDYMKNALFYPSTLLTAITDSGDVSSEMRPYTNWGDNARGKIPNANGGTDPNSGLALAYNLLSPSSTNPNKDANVARRGRRGATKIVIFETDGVPNCASNTIYNQQGYNSYYSFQSSLPNLTYYGDGSSSAINPALTIVDEIVAPASSSSSSGKSGFTLPNSQARVYAIGYGDLFDDAVNPAFVATSKDFLLKVQQHGKTSSATGTFPDAQIITGPYQTRIDNLRLALERILQGGVQVTLIE